MGNKCRKNAVVVGSEPVPRADLLEIRGYNRRVGNKQQKPCWNKQNRHSEKLLLHLAAVNDLNRKQSSFFGNQNVIQSFTAENG